MYVLPHPFERGCFKCGSLEHRAKHCPYAGESAEVRGNMRERAGVPREEPARLNQGRGHAGRGRGGSGSRGRG